MTIERHYRTKEVAELLACNPETILRLASRGEIASIMLGNERRYPESAIAAFLERAKAPTRSAPRAAAAVDIATRRRS